MKYEDIVSSDLLQLLNEIGYVATGRGRKEDARKIYDGIIAARPESEWPLISSAFSKIALGEFTDATKLLIEKATSINPQNPMISAMYGFLLYSVGRKSESRLILDKILAQNSSAEGHFSEEEALAEAIITEGKL